MREGGADFGPALLRLPVSLLLFHGEYVHVGGARRGASVWKHRDDAK
jgi:hypothetical protein